MAGRGGQWFQKRQKEQQRNERRQEKLTKRLERNRPADKMPSETSMGTTPSSDATEREPQ